MSDPDLGGPLLVTPAGSVIVATDALLSSADRLRTLEAALHADLRRVVTADAVASGMPIRGIAPALQQLRARCEGARDAFGRIAEDYTRVETAIERAQRDLAAMIAAYVGPAAVGFLARMVVLSPGLLLAGALLGWAAIPDGPDGRLETVRQFMIDHPELVTSPEFVRFVSLMATSIDEAALAGTGVPPWLVPIAGMLFPDNGVAAGALSVAALGSLFGMMRETPVSVERISTAPLEVAPAGVRHRLDSIPEGDQIRIEKYETEGMPPRFAVYIGPTETFSPFAADEPFDLTSSVHGVAGLSAGSFRAVELAMADAGITPGDEVLVSGFSQGGLIATMVAASGDWKVVGLETYGAPAGNIPLPAGISGMAIRNTDDLVPALAGPQLDHGVMQIERRAFLEGAEIPEVKGAPAHQRAAYEDTATAIDAAESVAVQAQIHALDAFAADYLDRPDGHATVMTYHATRETP